jgi:dipeptidyl aminopeptidase/acylaminoacyl peptidase
MSKRPINADDLYRIIDVEDVNVSPDERWIAWVQLTVDRLKNGYQRHIWLARADGSRPPVQLTRSGQDTQPRWSPDSQTLAFTSARGGKPQIHLIHLTEPGGEAYPITALPNGATSPSWSPDGTLLAFLSPLDASERAHEAESPPPPADRFEAQRRREAAERAEAERFDPMVVWRIPYRDGYGTTYMDERYRQIYVTPAAPDGKPQRLTDVDADHSAPVWTPDGQYILTSRPADPAADEPSRFDCLYRVRVADSLNERWTSDVYADRLPVVSPDGKWIAYIRTPHERQYTRVPLLAVIPTAGGAGRDLTLEMDRTAVDAKWSPDSQTVYFRAHSEGSTGIYRVSPDGGEIRKVYSHPGFIEVQSFDVGGQGGIAYAASTPEQPAEIFWLPAGADAPVKLTDVNRPLLDAVLVQPTYEARFANPGGETIQGWYIPPVGYEEGKRYPLIVYIHGGPRIMLNPASKVWHEWQFFAARGYAVFYCNAHGSDGYGYEFQRLSYGEPDFPDHMAGVDWMIERGIADPARLTVAGGSYGGYMTAWVVGHTDRFAAAVAERGVYNLVSQFGTSDFPIPTIHEFDKNPWEDPMLLWKYSPLAYAHQIRTPLLIIHSERDYRVAISEGEQLFAFVKLSGGTVQMVRFPREGHPLSRNGEPEHRVQRLMHIIGWFDRYCQPNADA